MKPFLDEEFLLSSDTARALYHQYAQKLPIIDYHCHIPPMDIALNRKYENMARLWLGENCYGDHYKWRLIRANGVDERYITGNATDRERFQAFAEMLPRAVGNPMVHWTQLELKRYFGCDMLLNGDTAEEIWQLCNQKLETMTVRDMIAMSGVEAIATTDDPVDDLRAHEIIRSDQSFSVRVVPAWRPDRAMNLRKNDFPAYIQKLSEVSGIRIYSFDTLCEALDRRMEYFDQMGCRASDHGLDYVPYSEEQADLDEILRRAMKGEFVSEGERTAYQYRLLKYMARRYAERDWVMQLHFGAVRNVNTRMYASIGADTGFDCMGDAGRAKDIVSFMNALETEDRLPKTVLYSLNHNDNAMLVSVINCFQGTRCPGKIQHGCAWWFNDTIDGMQAQLKTLAAGGLLGNFIGMLTDSRSFLSYTRHEYFRRLLCRILGEWVEDGQYPADFTVLGGLVADVSYHNAKRYFGF